MLAEVAGSSLEPSHISTPLRSSLHRTQVIRGHAAEIDLEQRRVILLIGLEDITCEEAAAILDVPIGTIRSRLSRGRESLR